MAAGEPVHLTASKNQKFSANEDWKWSCFDKTNKVFLDINSIAEFRHWSYELVIPPYTLNNSVTYLFAVEGKIIVIC